MFADLYWRYARREIQQKIELKMGEKNATLLSQHNSMVMIVNAALGGEESSGPSIPTPGKNGVKDLASGYGSVEDACAAINLAMMA